MKSVLRKVSVEDLHVIILIRKNKKWLKRLIMVSVEDLHVIILILRAYLLSRLHSLGFSRRPACYNTDTISLTV